MSMASNSQTAVPLSQHTAPVFRFDCLYTHDLIRKQKRWQDGILAFHTFNKRIMVYDLTSNFIGDTHWRDSESINVGDDLKLDRGVLVEVGEAKGRKDQDISEIFAKKTTQLGSQVSPLARNSVCTGLNSRVPKSLSAVLASRRGQLGRTKDPRSQSASLAWSSEVEPESFRPSKRPRIDTTPQRRQILALKETTNRILPVIARKPVQEGQPQPTGVELTNPTRSDVQDSQHPTTATKQFERLGQMQGCANAAAIGFNGNMPKSISQHKKKSKIGKQTVQQEMPSPKGEGLQNLHTANQSHASPHNERTVSEVVPLIGEPRRRLLSSKSRRKKLIFQSLSASEGVSQMASQLANEVPSTRKSRVHEHNSDSTITQRPFGRSDRDIILVSSQSEEEKDIDISEDDEHYCITPVRRKRHNRSQTTVNRTDRTLDSQAAPCVKDQSDHRELSPQASEVQREKSPQTEMDEKVDDFEQIGDTTMLAAFSESPIVRRHRAEADAAAQLQKRLVLDFAQLDDAEFLIDTPKPADTASVKLAKIEAASPLPSPSRGHEPRSGSSPTISTGLAAEAIDIPSPVLIPASPPIQSPQARSKSLLPPTEDSSITIQPVEHILPTESALPPEPEPSHIHTTKSFQPLAQAILNKPPAAAAPIPNQKPLPQFRPPQRTTRSSSSATNKRSPLRKSLSTTTAASYRDPNQTAQTLLARADSDSGTRASALVQQEYHQTGPWSREAFDLFGWTPDVPKGKVLGPVASRGCGCRAAAAAAAAVAATKEVGMETRTGEGVLDG